MLGEWSGDGNIYALATKQRKVEQEPRFVEDHQLDFEFTKGDWKGLGKAEHNALVLSRDDIMDIRRLESGMSSKTEAYQYFQLIIGPDAYRIVFLTQQKRSTRMWSA